MVNVTLRQIRNILSVNFSKNLEKLILGSFSQLLAWKTQSKIFCNKIFCCNFMLKIRKTACFGFSQILHKIRQNSCFHWPVFSCLGEKLRFCLYKEEYGSEKTCILAYFTLLKLEPILGPFGTKTPEQDFLRNLALLFFKLDGTLTFCKNHKICTGSSTEKLRKNGQTDVGYFKGTSPRKSNNTSSDKQGIAVNQ